MSTATAARPKASSHTMSAPKRKRRNRNAALGLIAWVVGLIFVSPGLWMLLTSFHSETDAATNPPSLFAPLTLEGYANFFGGAASPWPPLINSTIASVGSTILVLALAIPAAYALAIRPVQKWSDVMFFFLSTKMLPIVAALLPLYLIAQATGLLDDVVLLVLLYTAMNLPIAIWMMQSFLSEVPVEILESASIDGAGLPTIFRRIIIPISWPGIAATALIVFIFSWQELLFALVLTATESTTVTVFLTSFVSSRGLFLAQVSAAAVVVSLPVLIAGFAAQNKLVQGLSLGAVK